MWAMIVKEFRQLRRDRRTLAMMIVMPVVLLIVFGYAASFDVTTIPTVAAGPQASQAAHLLGQPFELVDVQPSQDRAWAEEQLRDGHAAVAVVTGAGRPEVLIDGSQLFTAKAAIASLSAMAAKAAVSGAAASGGQAAPGQASQVPPTITVLYNPGLKTSDIMIPGLAGVVLVFVGTIITSLGVVRERQSGTLEQLAVMPLKPRDVFLGKIVPYFAVAALDLAIVVGVGVTLFGVPFRGSLAVFALGALLFLFVTLGLGILISSVSENQGQAIQLAFMVTLPQVLLSGLIFPLSSIAAGVRWISYLLPLTYFNQISRGVMLRAEPLTALWRPFLFLALLGAVVFTLASLRFRAYLAPAAPRGGIRAPAQRPEPGRRGERGWRPGPPGAPGDRAGHRPGRRGLVGHRGRIRPVPEHSGPRPCLVPCRTGPGERGRRRRRGGPHHPAALPGRRARPEPAGRSGGPPRWRPGTWPPARVSTRTCRSRRTWRSAPPPTGSRRRRRGSAARNSSPGPGWTRSPGPAGRAAVRRHAAEARRDRGDAAPPGPAGARRADHRSGPGQPRRPVVADRPRGRRRRRGGAGDQLSRRG